MSKLKLLIFISLGIFGIKLIFDLLMTLIFVDIYDKFSLITETSLLLIVSFQFIGILKKYQLTWLLSLAQCGFIYYTSQGTFSWFFSYVLRSFNHYQPLQSYIIAALLISTEIAKTVILFKDKKD